MLPETFPIDSLGAYTNVSMTTDTLRTFQLHEDFATIDFKDCFEVKDMATLPSVSEARLLAFWSVPPKLQPRGHVSRRRDVIQAMTTVTDVDMNKDGMVSCAVMAYADEMWRAMLSSLSRPAECRMLV